MVATGLLLSGAAIGLAREGALSQKEYAYTSFWLTPHADAAGLATIGVTNNEKVSTSYRIEIVAGGQTVGRWPPFRLEAGQTFLRELPLHWPQASAGRIEAWLFKDDNASAIYRKVSTPVRDLVGGGGASSSVPLRCSDKGNEPVPTSVTAHPHLSGTPCERQGGLPDHTDRLR
jgi:hypothetical protein